MLCDETRGDILHTSGDDDISTSILAICQGDDDERMCSLGDIARYCHRAPDSDDSTLCSLGAISVIEGGIVDSDISLYYCVVDILVVSTIA